MEWNDSAWISLIQLYHFQIFRMEFRYIGFSINKHLSIALCSPTASKRISR